MFNVNRNYVESCRGCTERYPACHDHCEKYITARKKYDELQNKIWEDKHNPLLVYKAEKIAKAQKRRK